MNKMTLGICTLALGLICWNASDLRAAESTTTTSTTTTTAPVQTTAPTTTTTTHYEQSSGGNWFTNFWVHRVGGTIGNGLKTGTKKIDHAFTGNNEGTPVQTTTTTVTKKEEVKTELPK